MVVLILSLLLFWFLGSVFTVVISDSYWESYCPVGENNSYLSSNGVEWFLFVVVWPVALVCCFLEYCTMYGFGTFLINVLFFPLRVGNFISRLIRKVNENVNS